VSILVEGNVPPILPETTSLGNTYPNPFRMNSVTSLEVEVKAGESGRVTIYNVIGQTVKTFSVAKASTSLTGTAQTTRAGAAAAESILPGSARPALPRSKNS
jgi:hypothetical protein